MASFRDSLILRALNWPLSRSLRQDELYLAASESPLPHSNLEISLRRIGVSLNPAFDQIYSKMQVYNYFTSP